MEVIEQLADQRLVELSADLQVQLEKGTGTRPVLWMLTQARKRAAKAIDLFIDVAPEDVDQVKNIKHELTIYNDLIGLARELLERGKEADNRIKEGDRAAIDELVQQMTPDERRLMRLEPQQKD